MDIGTMWTAIGVGLALLIAILGGFRWVYGRLDKKFDAVDKRFESVDKKFESMMTEIKEQRAEIMTEIKEQRIELTYSLA